MLSHVRIKNDAFNKKPGESTDPAELQSLYAVISKAHSASPPEKSSRPKFRNPFLLFQNASSDEEDEGSGSEAADDDEPSCVRKQLQMGETVIIGVMLMSNGAKMPAESYANGDDGFISKERTWGWHRRVA